ncbi:MAG: response regulator [Acidobacteriota bacterium]|nr:response regulator [Acidobacteriota bacterium]MDQ5837932.1 response regulator [Acidobacteriota bacterium]
MQQIRLATSLEQAGRFREAREALRELWPSTDVPPLLDGLDPEMAAQFLHRAGSLADALRGEETSGADAAEELLSLSLALYEELGDRASASSVRITLACCLWHRGAADRTRDLLREALAVRHSSREKFTPPPNWSNFNLPREVRRYERLIIERALKDAGGRVSRAAHLLGFKHHNSLISRINKRHSALLASRSPIIPRKQGIMRVEVDAETPAVPAHARPTVLHVVNDRVVAEAVKEQLEADGWRVETSDAKAALRKLAGDAQFNVLLFDGDLPGVSGPELVRAAKAIPRRRSTPVVILSARNCEAAAWRAGVAAYLHKPEGLAQVSQIMARLRGG